MATNESTEILKAGSIDGKEYSKGDSAKLTPFQRKIAAREGLVKAPVAPMTTENTAIASAPKKTARKTARKAAAKK